MRENGNLCIATLYKYFPIIESLVLYLERKERVWIRGIGGTPLSLLISLLRKHIKNNILILAEKEESEVIYSNLKEILGNQVIHLPVLKEKREKVIFLHRFLTQTPGILVTEHEILNEPLTSKEKLISNFLKIKVGNLIKREYLIKWLSDNEYIRSERVEFPGEWCVRGSIIDIYVPEEEYAYRIELEEEKVISIRAFNPENQRSVYHLEEITIPPLGGWEDKETNILSFLSSGDLVILQEAKNLKESYKESKIISWSSFLKYLSELKTIFTSWLPIPPPLIIHREISLPFQSLKGFTYSFNTLFSALSRWEKENYTIYLAGFEESERENFENILKERNIRNFKFIKERLHEGFISDAFKFVILTPHEIRGYQPLQKHSPRGFPLTHPFDLEIGDYVVHVIHGIGKYLGLRKEKNKEFLVVEYEGGDLLYVPVEGIHLLEKYVGISDTPPQLSRLGSPRWRKTKERVARAVKDLASELLHLHAWRLSKPGFAFSPDSQWQKEFEATFPYKITPDQEKSIEEVKKDMESPHPMDRLICGDTGFGKTEVAMRAAFKAVMDGKQVAVLVPTTLLAHQHFMNFKERMKDFPIKIEVLSRFVSKKERERILEELKTGKIDIIIGTHILLQENIIFKDLGLLIIDEEQRFGVRQKEKIKFLKKEVDVLTLSATPIPRTLYLSLVGLRDISLIQTPPPERLEVEIFITEFNLSVIKEAIEREIKRKGQVFFVHNRIQDLEKFEKIIKKLVPNAKTSIIHGKLPSSKIEKIMLYFIHKKIDVLITTTIIASGLDIPNANTIIINEAHKFGLADLYQLRGRVGRYKLKAYAYFLIPPKTLLSPEARKRLYAIEDFSKLGKGYQLALSDLEIRGAGNILGEEQHGHIQAVGLSLYTELLAKAVAEIKGEKYLLYIPTQIEIGIPATLDIPFLGEREKLHYYKRISMITREEEIKEIEKELMDRFGTLTPKTHNLLLLQKAKLEAYKRGIEYIKRIKQTLYLRFIPSIQLKKRAELLHSFFPGKIFINPQGEIGYKLTSPFSLHHLLDLLSHLPQVH